MDDIIVEPIFPIKLFDDFEKFDIFEYFEKYSKLIKGIDNKREIDNYNNIVIKAYNSLLSINKELFDDIEFTTLLIIKGNVVKSPRINVIVALLTDAV